VRGHSGAGEAARGGRRGRRNGAVTAAWESGDGIRIRLETAATTLSRGAAGALPLSALTMAAWRRARQQRRACPPAWQAPLVPRGPRPCPLPAASLVASLSSGPLVIPGEWTDAAAGSANTMLSCGPVHVSGLVRVRTGVAVGLWLAGHSGSPMTVAFLLACSLSFFFWHNFCLFAVRITNPKCEVCQSPIPPIS